MIDEIKKKFKGVRVKKHSPRRFYSEIDRERLPDLGRFLYEEKGCRLSTATGTDTRRGLEVMYHFGLDKTGVIYSIRAVVPKDDPKIKSLATFLPAADWIEREMRELLGIEFEGHPNPKPLLTSEDWPRDRYPLRRKG